MCVCVYVYIYIYIYSWFGLQGKTCTMKQKCNNIQKKNSGSWSFRMPATSKRRHVRILVDHR